MEHLSFILSIMAKLAKTGLAIMAVSALAGFGFYAGLVHASRRWPWKIESTQKGSMTVRLKEDDQ
jgi:hypothetical protein